MTALCTKRPKWSRRGFLLLAGAAAIGAMLPAAPVARSFEVVLEWDGKNYIRYEPSYRPGW